MPELDGPQTAIEIRHICDKAGRQSPFIVCVSAHEEAHFEKVSITAGMDCFFTKPLLPEYIEEIKKRLD